VAGGWKRLHNEELLNLYASLTVVRVIKSSRLRWSHCVACTGEMRNVYEILGRKPEEKRPLGRLRRRWENNIRMALRCWDSVDWIHPNEDMA
jgi:hypothetical protein